MTSRDSSEASAFASSAESILPSMNPPLSTRVGNFFAASTTDLAAATGSPSTNATAEGPSNRTSSSATPASLTARRIRVFLTTANFVPPSARDRRSSVISDTVRPRYSVSSRASDPSIRSLSSATRSTFSCLGIAPPDMKQRASADSGDAHRQVLRCSVRLGRCPVIGITRGERPCCLRPGKDTGGQLPRQRSGTALTGLDSLRASLEPRREGEQVAGSVGERVVASQEPAQTTAGAPTGSTIEASGRG